MTDRRLFSFIDALAAGRRPKPFKAAPEDVDVLRAAIELRASRPGDAIPDERFVSDLYQSLVEQSDVATVTNVRPLAPRRVRLALVSVAAGLVLVGGTFVATKSFNTPSSSPSTAAFGVPPRHALRTGTFETRSGVVLGQIVAYNGHPSWVYLNVGVSPSTGTIICKLQLDNGSIVAAGVINLHRGIGELSKSVLVDISRLKGAQLSTSTGSVLASATFT